MPEPRAARIDQLGRCLVRHARTTDPQPGIAARWPGVCPVCDDGIAVGDRISYRKGEPVHCRCVNGADDA